MAAADSNKAQSAQYDAVAEIKSLGEAYGAKIKGLQDDLARLQRQINLGQPGGAAEDVELKAMMDNLARMSRHEEVKDANTVATQASMGYLAATTYQQGVVRRMIDLDPVLQECNSISLGGNATYIAVESEPPTAQFVEEIAARPEVQPKIGQVTLQLKEAGVDVALSNALIRDANVVGVETYVQDAVAKAFSRLLGGVVLTGTGTTQPEGILTSSKLVKETAAIGAEAIYDLESAIPDEADANAKYFMSKATFYKFVKAFGTASNYVTMPLDAATRPMIHGHEVVFCGSMPSTGTVALYGDMRAAYTIGTNGAMTYALYDPYSKANVGQTVYHFAAAMGGAFVQPQALVGLAVE